MLVKTDTEKDTLSSSQNKDVSVRNGHSGSHTLTRDVMCIYFVSLYFRFCLNSMHKAVRGKDLSVLTEVNEITFMCVV
jgi:hypothetical protein